MLYVIKKKYLENTNKKLGNTNVILNSPKQIVSRNMKRPPMKVPKINMKML